MLHPPNPHIVSIVLNVVQVTPQTRWSFVEVTDSQGRTGAGEATLNKREAELAQAAQTLFPRFIGTHVFEADPANQVTAECALPEAAILSAVDHALWDLRAHTRAAPLAGLLAERRIDRAVSVPVYANINRRTRDRSPQGFANSARDAILAGHRAIKIAPFDGVELYGRADASVATGRLDEGLARIAATREAIGGDIDLMVDCHWRLNEKTALALLDGLAGEQLHWIECPLPESPEMLEPIRRIRAKANALGVRLAGAEQTTHIDTCRAILEANAYDVIMPDVKYIGGVRKMLEAAALAARHGVEFSPHNPSGPVAHAVTLHLCAVAAGFRRMEMQFDETPLFDALVGQRLPQARGGAVTLPGSAGHGAILDPRLTQEKLFLRLSR